MERLMGKNEPLTPEMQQLVDALYAMNAAFPSVVDVMRNLGADVIKTPDGVITDVIDAPAIEYPDGRKYREDGTTY